jgi:hypothetical protein
MCSTGAGEASFVRFFPALRGGWLRWASSSDSLFLKTKARQLNSLKILSTKKNGFHLLKEEEKDRLLKRY